MKITAQCLLACLSLLATTAQAVPVSFQFSTVIDSVSRGFSAGGEPLAVPAPFDQPFAVLGESITGSFTIETGVPAFPALEVVNGALVAVGLFHLNPVVQFDLTVAGQLFSLVSARPPLGSGVLESYFLARDLPQPRADPFTNYDAYQLNANFGTGQLAPPFAGLNVSATLIRQEFDLTQIQSTDLLLGLSAPAQWSLFFTFLDPRTTADYQVHGVVTDLRQVIEAPEPGIAGLFIVGLGLLGLAMRRRRQPPEASLITRCGVAIA